MGSDSYITSLRKTGYNCLPDHILLILERQKTGLDTQPYLIFNNLPVDETINGSPKFLESGPEFKSGCVSENVLCMIGTMLGEPYSIFFEGQELVNNLTPHLETSNQYTGLGSDVELDLHIENSALRFFDEHDYSPLGLLLLGVRHQSDSNGGPYTTVVDARLALSQLNPPKRLKYCVAITIWYGCHTDGGKHLLAPRIVLSHALCFQELPIF